MSVWMVSMALAAEPVVGVGTSDPQAPELDRTEIVLGWDEVGYREAAPESPALGPDRLALGPDGAAAVYDPVHKRVVVVGGAAFAVPAADGIGFSARGFVLVMDDGSRRLRAYRTDGTLLDEEAFPGVVPPGGALRVEGALVTSVDAFGNGHPLATVGDNGALTRPAGPSLVPPARRVVRSGQALLVDGRAVATVGGRGGARLLGDWLLVESMDDGVLTRRVIPLDGGETVAVPLDGRLYAPTEDVAVGPDGDLAWMRPMSDGLRIVRVTP